MTTEAPYKGFGCRLHRGLAIDEKSYGPAHPSVAISLNDLGFPHAERGAWAEASRLHLRAKPIMTGAHGKEAGSMAKVALTRNTRNLRAAARAVHRADGRSLRAREEGFELAQWALQTGAADALAQMSVRFAKGAGPLAALVREHQDLVARQEGEDKRLLAAAGKADAKAAEAVRAAISGLDARLAAVDERLAAEFPDYAQLSNPRRKSGRKWSRELASHSDESHYRVLLKPCGNSRFVLLPTLKNRQWEKSVGSPGHRPQAAFPFTPRQIGQLTACPRRHRLIGIEEVVELLSRHRQAVWASFNLRRIRQHGGRTSILACLRDRRSLPSARSAAAKLQSLELRAPSWRTPGRGRRWPE